MRTTILAAAVLMVAATPLAAGSVSGNAGCDGKCENYLVYLEGAPGARGGELKAVFDQKDKVFIPHVLPVVAGTTVDIKNGDPFLHNVHVYKGKETVLNIALPFQGQVIPYKFEERGTYAVSCDAHPEMSAFIVVLDTAYFAGVGADGAYEIADVPPGSYTLVVRDVKKGEESKSPVVVN